MKKSRFIAKKLIDLRDFVPKALEFEVEHELNFCHFYSAIKFLSLYATLLASNEYEDEEDLLRVYLLVLSTLKQKREISSKEFLSKPHQPFQLKILNDTTCIIEPET